MYLAWNKQTIIDFSEKNIEALYSKGYVFTRTGRGDMNQTRSLRLDLKTFALSSENKRILKKTEDLQLGTSSIPYANYSWQIHKLGKDFYEQKFGEKTFSAQKIKELITDPSQSNFNRLFTYTQNNEQIGYCIALETGGILHYCYPFYNLQTAPTNTGMSMMLRAIIWAQEQGKQYIYLGSAQRPTDTYKLQFSGLEWFDGSAWIKDADKLKQILNNLS